jgi:tetratricopeptide (TPR) repeat protein
MLDAQKSLQTVETELVIPSGASPQAVESNKALLRAIAFAAIGNVFLVKADYPRAEEYLKKSVELSPATADAITWLRYAVSLDMQNKLRDAMTAINRAVELAPAGSVQAKLAQDERQRLLRRGGGALAKPAAQSSTNPAR